ncbi:helix-turn-helix transcriptional regulator [Chitinophaga arvensicola]|uniref:AraC-type DNA-binding protein n=1 Tax=Chitinophaga arvensicola TaxID=29529 RepID=A0A1I0SAS2_9BACT|nr:AraC family transcriptional regulator [Chitinophaga arvensicola]SEW53534.1 AraC-type DNA-binding protein [Chitinophaga arvensicola]
MGVVITDEANQVLLTEDMPFDYHKIRSRGMIEETQVMREDFGAATVHEFNFEGTSIACCKAEVYKNINILSDYREPRVMMLFMEQGDITTRMEGISDHFRFSTLEHNLMFSPGEADSAAVKKQRDILFFGMSFTPSRFLELAENNGKVLDGLANHVAGNKSARLADKINPRITPRMRMVMEEVRQCRFQGGLKKLFLQSKAIELLALQCEQVETATATGISLSAKINPQDVEKLYYARDLLLQHMQQPLSLEQLARKTGLNEFKLKSGFKAVFDNTVFGYLNDHRLELARELVLSGTLPMAMIAEQAGYSSPQHFSTAFRKKFGVSPGKIRG